MLAMEAIIIRLSRMCSQDLRSQGGRRIVARHLVCRCVLRNTNMERNTTRTGARNTARGGRGAPKEPRHVAWASAPGRAPTPPQSPERATADQRFGKDCRRPVGARNLLKSLHYMPSPLRGSGNLLSSPQSQRSALPHGLPLSPGAATAPPPRTASSPRAANGSSGRICTQTAPMHGSSLEALHSSEKAEGRSLAAAAPTEPAKGADLQADGGFVEARGTDRPARGG
jgi:hypothetical protein